MSGTCGVLDDPWRLRVGGVELALGDMRRIVARFVGRLCCQSQQVIYLSTAVGNLFDRNVHGFT